jgi:hypothetical protein
MKNKKRKTGEEIKEHKKRAKQNKVSCLTHAHYQTAADLLVQQVRCCLVVRRVELAG